jgi:rhamnosyltransferase subunit B
MNRRFQFLLNPIGSAGDVHPFMAIGQRLLQRNHEVVVLTNPVFRQSALKSGLQFVPVGTRDEMRKVGTNPKIHRQMHAWKLALQWGATGTMRETFHALEQPCRNKPTVVVTAALGFGARIAGEKRGTSFR